MASLYFPIGQVTVEFLLRPNGRDVRRVTFPDAARPNGGLHWATVVAHSVRWLLMRLTLNNTLGEHSIWLKKQIPFFSLFIYHQQNYIALPFP